MIIREVSIIYLEWAETYYRKPSGKATRHAKNLLHANRPLVAMLGRRVFDKLRVSNVLAVRESMIESGLARTTVNSRMRHCRRFVRWSIQRGHASPRAILPWQAVDSLKYGRTSARETLPVTSARLADVEATAAVLDEQLQRMIALQLATGMRSSELCSIRWDLIDRTNAVWIYRPAEHKTEHFGHSRLIPITNKTCGLLGELKRRGFVFTTNTGKPFNRDTYRQTIKRAIDRAGCADWTPHQFRHNAITRWASTGDIESVRLLAGHSTLRETSRYITDSVDRVIAAAKKIA